MARLYTNEADEKKQQWDLSSAGRASALQAEGHRFEPYRSHSVTKTDIDRPQPVLSVEMSERM